MSNSFPIENKFLIFCHVLQWSLVLRQKSERCIQIGMMQMLLLLWLVIRLAKKMIKLEII